MIDIYNDLDNKNNIDDNKDNLTNKKDNLSEKKNIEEVSLVLSEKKNDLEKVSDNYRKNKK